MKRINFLSCTVWYQDKEIHYVFNLIWKYTFISHLYFNILIFQYDYSLSKSFDMINDTIHHLPLYLIYKKICDDTVLMIHGSPSLALGSFTSQWTMRPECTRGNDRVGRTHSCSNHMWTQIFSYSFSHLHICRGLMHGQ